MSNHGNVLTWCWEMGSERHLIVINFSDTPSQAMIHLPWDNLRGRAWRLSDSLAGETFKHSGDDMAEHGLFISLDPWSWHFLRLESFS